MSDTVIEEYSAIVKGSSGIRAIDIGVSRSKLGITINVRTISEVEDFMRSLGSGERVNTASAGRYWAPLQTITRDETTGAVTRTDGPPLYVYDLRQALEPGVLDNGGGYRLDQPGGPLLYSGTEMVNLSILRLIGTSEGTGVTFNLKGSVYTEGALKNLKDQLSKAARKFYIDYIRPVDFRGTVILSSQEFNYVR